MQPRGERRSRERGKNNSFDIRKRWINITAIAGVAVFIVLLIQFSSLWRDYKKAFGEGSLTQQWINRKLINYSLDTVDMLYALNRLELITLQHSEKKISTETLTSRRRQMVSMLDNFSPDTALWRELHSIESFGEAYANAKAFVESVHQYELGNLEIDGVIALGETSVTSWTLFKGEATHREFELRDNMERTIKTFIPIGDSTGPVFLVLSCFSILLYFIGVYAVSEVIRIQHRRFRRFELLVASISHDLNSPLQAIQNAGSLLSNRLSPSDRRKYSIIVSNSIKTLSRLVRDISLAAQGADIELQLDYVNVEKWFTEFIVSYKERAAKRGLSLTSTIDAHNQLIEIDTERVAQSIGNLLDNAIKYTAKGSVSVSVRLRAQEVSGHRRLLVVKVRDTGLGIAQNNLERIFKPFERAVPIGHPQEHGMGLGLSIVQRIAKSHGGTIAVTSKIGGGSMFKLTLPVNTQALEESIPWKKQSDFHEYEAANQAKESSVKEILVVDDDENISATIVGILNEAGFAVDTASDGVEALAAIADYPYKVVITDIQMPGLNGFELARTIRSLAGNSNPYLIGMTAKQDDLALDPNSVIFNGTLSKPFNEEELIYLIEQGIEGDKKTSRKTSEWGSLK